MDFINGGELFTYINREKRFSEERSRFYAAEIILALEYLHEMDIIYRDLKVLSLMPVGFSDNFDSLRTSCWTAMVTSGSRTSDFPRMR